MPKRKAPANTYWRGDTLFGRIIVAGREIRWSLRTDDPKVAGQRVKARQQREIAAAHYGEDRLTWGDAVLAWGEHIQASVKPSTAKRYATSIKQIDERLKGLFLDEIDKALISEIIRRRRATGATNATIRRDLTALSSVLGFAEEEGWREDNPALLRLRRLKERRDPIVLPELADIERVIARAPGNFAHLIRVALLTGCRQEELVSLERRQIDHARRQLALHRTKGGRPRVLDLSPEAYEALRAVPISLGTRHVFWRGDAQQGPYLNVSSRFRVFVLAAQKTAREQGAEFRPFRFHDLRHRFAVDYLKNRRGALYDLQMHLGHSSVRVTEIYLAYLTPEEARAAKHGTAQNLAPMQRFAEEEGA